jgi:hypothetical protein
MADAKAMKSPNPQIRPMIRFGFGAVGVKKDGSLRSLGLGVGVATANGQINYEVIPIFGAASVSVRLKVATNGGTLDLFSVGPDFNPEQGAIDNTAFGSLVGTIHTTGNPSQVAVTAGTEAIITWTGKGEGYLIIKYTGAVGAGTITYCDVAQHPQSF